MSRTKHRKTVDLTLDDAVQARARVFVRLAQGEKVTYEKIVEEMHADLRVENATLRERIAELEAAAKLPPVAS